MNMLFDSPRLLNHLCKKFIGFNKSKEKVAILCKNNNILNF